METASKNKVLVLEARQPKMDHKDWVKFFSSLVIDPNLSLDDVAVDYIKGKIYHHSFYEARGDKRSSCNHSDRYYGELPWKRVGDWYYFKRGRECQGIIAEGRSCCQVVLFKRKTWHRMMRRIRMEKR